MMSKTTISLLVVFFGLGCMDISPKKYGYPRIEFPERSYSLFSPANCPFSFESPAYSLVEKDTHSRSEPCWYNIKFPSFDATIYLSYKSFESSLALDTLSEQAYKMAMKNNVKADIINETEIKDTVNGNYGVLYDLYGESATPFNFYLTDEKKHYLRGSFYFNNTANTDSIEPIYAWLKKDMMKLIRSVQWKN